MSNATSSQQGGLTTQVIRWAVMVETGERETHLGFLNTAARKISNPEVLDFIIIDRIGGYLRRGGDDHVAEIFARFKEIVSDNADISQLEESYRRITSLAPGSPAPDFAIFTPEDKEHKLSDLRGKLLYIDIWATWCGPCLQQKPHFERLANQFKDDDRIKFIAISVDANVGAWKRRIEGGNPNVQHFIVQNAMQSDLCKLYGISSIPRFMLIDRNGRVIDISAPLPSTENMEAILRQHLAR